MTVNIFGAGSWGIAFSAYLSHLNYNVNLYSRNVNNIGLIPLLKNNAKSENINSNKNINIYNDLHNFNFSDLNILAVPSSSLSDLLHKIKKNNSKYLILTKGFDLKSKLLPLDLLSSIHKISENNIAVLSGPNHAEEVRLLKPTTSVIASKNDMFSSELQRFLSSDIFRIYTTNDVNGVQILAAVKNVIAIASGLCEGLMLGDNAQASLITRAINELLELKKIYNFSSDTLYGIPGIGDLLCTCYSNHSRNKMFGFNFIKTNNYNLAIKKIGMTVEGVNTAKILYNIINENNLDMPICKEVYKIIFEGTDPMKSLNVLMNRKL